MWLTVEEDEYNETEATTMSKEEEDDEDDEYSEKEGSGEDEKEDFGEEKWRECRKCCYEHDCVNLYDCGRQSSEYQYFYHLVIFLL